MFQPHRDVAAAVIVAGLGGCSDSGTVATPAVELSARLDLHGRETPIFPFQQIPLSILVAGISGAPPGGVAADGELRFTGPGGMPVFAVAINAGVNQVVLPQISGRWSCIGQALVGERLVRIPAAVEIEVATYSAGIVVHRGTAPDERLVSLSGADQGRDFNLLLFRDQSGRGDLTAVSILPSSQGVVRLFGWSYMPQGGVLHAQVMIAAGQGSSERASPRIQPIPIPSPLAANAGFNLALQECVWTSGVPSSVLVEGNLYGGRVTMQFLPSGPQRQFSIQPGAGELAVTPDISDSPLPYGDGLVQLSVAVTGSQGTVVQGGIVAIVRR